MTHGEMVNDSIALAAASNPVWLPYVHGPSPTLALVLQVMGILWLFIQMSRWLYSCRGVLVEIGHELKNPWLALAVAAMLAIIILFFLLPIGALRAHDHNHPEQEGWFRSLHSKGGAWCCTGDDAEIVDWELMCDHYRVHLGDQWMTVPEDAIVEGANKVGGARVWTYFADGHQHVRCFLPDSLT